MVKNTNVRLFVKGGGINYFLGNYKENSVNKTTKDKSKRLISL